MAWPKDELRKIAGSDDLHVSPFREDSVCVRKKAPKKLGAGVARLTGSGKPPS